jgi:hypothetical protein
VRMTLQLFHFRLTFLPLSLASSSYQLRPTTVCAPFLDNKPIFVTFSVKSASLVVGLAGVEDSKPAAEFFLSGGAVI